MQVPAEFDYAKATSVDAALTLLARYGPEARVVAGGHSLLPMMRLRLATPHALIDINDVAELATITVDTSTGSDGRLRVGAMVRHAELLASAEAGRLFPILHDAERVIADPVVRNRGTVGGSLCQADPSEDLSAAFAALSAEVVIRGLTGERTVPVREFHLGPYETAVGPGELLTEIRVPIRPGGSSAYEKVERRVGDWPVAAVGAALWLDGGLIADAGIGLTAVGAPHFAAPEAEAALRGAAPSDQAFAEAARLAAEHCSPAADQRGPVDYKRHLAGELTRRALRRALTRVTGRPRS